MIEEQRAGALQALVMVVPTLLGDQGEALTEFIAELLSPVWLLLLSIVLLLTIQFLSSDTGSFVPPSPPAN
ncbi:hypothetical protein SASPL_109258 [Salvia splendens]|uniref:Uncharacterized protein n=1 Tax=Salvia splendens TaxID=180675 RepID=A0A8X8YEM6_SALSN|nr:hypothetical protein SASPL_109258 [Salvia splendens]